MRRSRRGVAHLSLSFAAPSLRCGYWSIIIHSHCEYIYLHRRPLRWITARRRPSAVKIDGGIAPRGGSPRKISRCRYRCTECTHPLPLGRGSRRVSGVAGFADDSLCVPVRGNACDGGSSSNSVCELKKRWIGLLTSPTRGCAAAFRVCKATFSALDRVRRW